MTMGTVTFLFTDIEGSTAGLRRLGDAAYSSVLADHHRIIRIGLALGPARRRVDITRRNARYRRIVNECEVEALLQEFGFETHELEGYSVRDQIALFAEAEMVAGAHGAGLTNILFSPPGLKVIDIFEGSLFNKCFWDRRRVEWRRLPRSCSLARDVLPNADRDWWNEVRPKEPPQAWVLPWASLVQA